MKKNPIGIIDVSVDGLNILSSLTKEFKNEDFIYFNDIKNLPYEGKDPSIIHKYIKANLEFLLSQNIKLLIVISDTICEYGEEILSSINVPVIQIVDSIINYMNKNYENKNIILCSKDYILKANLYQKNIKYNHLYSISSNKMESIISNDKIKTMKSFNVAFDSFKTIQSKDLDVLVYTAPWIELLKTEINEALKVKEIIKIGDIISSSIKESKIDFYKNRKGKITVFTTASKEEFSKLIPWFNLKYKFNQIELDYGQDRTTEKDNK